ncbi:DUF441 domain-containing protein [Lederbergia citrea]|uniref:DUF441 domain-containing protein n=1 Tax=Lederbergia citrea TaxID=2833581 RepID=UPI001BCA403D|nr:DUF441 domain-containing protein [Lederbergia citrea]MBS4176063.1 DUF441 domain-containing protein [Lederbergia citrea]MBS4202624.1 DUF441 domain-containing protein [Lederbergia citrea]
MFNQPFLFMLMLLAIGIIAKNQSLIIAASVLIVLKLLGADEKIFTSLQTKGINWGVTIITIAVLAPIASGYIGFKELGNAIKSPYAWIALGAGMGVAVIAKYGVQLLSVDPHITTALVIGTIFAVAVFKGVAVGPLIGAGIAYMAMKIFELIKPG